MINTLCPQKTPPASLLFRGKKLILSDLSIASDSSFYGKIATCIHEALEPRLGKNVSLLIEHLIISEIKGSFGLDLPPESKFVDVINEACKKYCIPRSLCCPPGEELVILS